jgi:hypothetical protein
MFQVGWVYKNNFIYQIRHNTVIEKNSVTVHYPHHPYYKKTLPIVEIHHKGHPPGYVCQTSEYGTLFIPKWMTYPEATQGCAIAANAQVSFESLLQVAEFVNDTESCSALINQNDSVTKS